MILNPGEKSAFGTVWMKIAPDERHLLPLPLAGEGRGEGFYRGFTLMEILVVLVIISIAMTFAVLAFGDFGASRRLETQVEQLVNTLKLAQQQAILESGTLGLSVNKNGWQFFRFVPPKTWSPIKKNIFRLHYFPKNTQLILKTGFRAKAGYPDIIINASGNITPFVMQIGNISQPNMLLITGLLSGKLTLERIT